MPAFPGRAFLRQPGVIPFAHRGGAGEAPENTLPAFEAAVQLGYRYLETDVHATRDGEVVAFHDARLDRVTDRHGAIAALSLAEVRAADAGHWFTTDGGVTFPFRERGVRVATLVELLDRFPDAYFNIDPKHDLAARPLVHTLRRMGAMHRVCIGCFADRRLAMLRALSNGALCTSMGQAAIGVAYLQSRRRGAAIPRLNADCVQVPTRWRVLGIVDSRFMAAAHAAGLPVHVWTVNDEPGIRSLLELGVDGIMTDHPRLLRDVLQARGLWSQPYDRNLIHADAAN